MENKTQKIGKVRDDYEGEKPLIFTVEETELKLDYSAMSIGIDLKGKYDISKIELRTMELNHRILERTLAIYTSFTNQEKDFKKKKIGY